MPEHRKRLHGAQAGTPLAIPSKGWWQVLLRVKGEIGNDNISIVAAGVAFYTLLAVFPALAALVMVYGLMSDPAEVSAQLAPLRDVMPEAAFSIMDDQLTSLSQNGAAATRLGLLLTIALAIWSSSKGIKAIFTAINIAYEERESRGWIRLNLTALVFTAGAILFVVASIGLIAVLPTALAFIDTSGTLATAVLWLRWPLIMCIAIVALAVVYRWGPSRTPARFRWITPGAVVAILLWLAGSIGFSYYVENFASYNKTYGSLGAVVILLFWFYLTAYCICLGAELNAELEHQTRRDSTTGNDQPFGSRGAFVADHWAGDGRIVNN